MKHLPSEYSADDRLRSPLSRLLFAALEESDSWIPADYPDVLRAMLRLPCSRLVPRNAREDASLARLFEMPAPPANLVRLVKDDAKAELRAAAPRIPRPVARVVYYACVALAHRKRLVGVTTLDAASLQTGIDWCLSQTWISQDLLLSLALTTTHR